MNTLSWQRTMYTRGVRCCLACRLVREVTPLFPYRSTTNWKRFHAISRYCGLSKNLSTNSSFVRRCAGQGDAKHAHIQREARWKSTTPLMKSKIALLARRIGHPLPESIRYMPGVALGSPVRLGRKGDWNCQDYSISTMCRFMLPVVRDGAGVDRRRPVLPVKYGGWPSMPRQPGPVEERTIKRRTDCAIPKMTTGATPTILEACAVCRMSDGSRKEFSNAN